VPSSFQRQEESSLPSQRPNPHPHHPLAPLGRDATPQPHLHVAEVSSPRRHPSTNAPPSPTPGTRVSQPRDAGVTGAQPSRRAHARGARGVSPRQTSSFRGAGAAQRDSDAEQAWQSLTQPAQQQHSSRDEGDNATNSPYAR
jgi:hypothetical protein